MNKINGIDVPEGFGDLEINDGFAAHIGPLYWKLDKNSCEIGFRVLDHHLNPGKTCHGGLMMTVADMAVGFAAIWERQLSCFAPSINNNYDFISPGYLGDWMQTELEVIQTTKRMGFVRGLLNGPKGPVMRFNGILKIPSETDPRYNAKHFSARMQRLYEKYK
jgi:acyl-coenzyme A thioesterase PaaI-like protein